MTPQEQGHVFAAMALCGVCLGVVYDLLGPLRRAAWLCAPSDLLFGVICAAGIAAAALHLRCEPFRLYVFAGVACGMILYGATMGSLLRHIGRSMRKRKRETEEKYKKRQSAAGI